MEDNDIYSARIMIVDDQAANVALLESILAQAGYRACVGFTDAREVLPKVAASQPDLVLLDLHMPFIDGFAVLEGIAAIVPAGTFLPILVLTADGERGNRHRALSLGAHDYLSKPFDRLEVLLRVRNLLQTRAQYLRLQHQNRLLEQRIQERTQELLDAQREILERLALAAEYRDDSTGQHTQRVGRIAADIARALGLPEAQVDLIGQAAALHDIGKIGICDQILLKPGKLTSEEYAMMQSHTTIGARILSGSRFALLQLAYEIACAHQERWDGSGYPRGLAGEAIPLAGCIVAVADVFDALTHDRPYKAAWPVVAALAEIERQSGRLFHPGVVAAFLATVAAQRGDPAPALGSTRAGSPPWAAPPVDARAAVMAQGGEGASAALTPVPSMASGSQDPGP